MSLAMIQAFKGIQATPTQRLVAYMLADCHNEQTGRCDPSIPYLCDLTSLSRRAVINALEGLEEAGHLTSSKREGIRTIYTLHPCTTCTRAPDAPVQEMHGTRAPDALPPVHEVHQTRARGAPEPELTGTLTRKEPEPKRPAAKTAEPTFPADLNDEYRQVLTRWWNYKRERRETYKPMGWEVLVKQQRAKSLPDLVRDIEHSMAANYAGIYPPKDGRSTAFRQSRNPAYDPASATAGKTADQIGTF